MQLFLQYFNDMGIQAGWYIMSHSKKVLGSNLLPTWHPSVCSFHARPTPVSGLSGCTGFLSKYKDMHVSG